MGAWRGLGMNTSHSAVVSRFKEYLREFTRHGINFIRMSLPDYTDDETINLAKEDILEALAEGFNVIWGVSSNPTALTATNWDDFANKVLEIAQWCQNNSVHGFIIGNEEEAHNSVESIDSMFRTDNVVTVNFSYTHGFQEGETVNIAGASEANFNGNGETITGVTDTTFTYSKVGSDGSATGTLTAKLSSESLRNRLRSLATACKAIFTNGDIHYNVATNACEGWISDDNLGDIDRLGLNIYLNNKLSDGTSSAYPSLITSLISAFTSENAYISEFSINSISCETYSLFEDTQAIAVANMQKTMQALGITRAYFFKYLDPDFGAIKEFGGDFRILWNPLTTNGGRWYLT